MPFIFVNEKHIYEKKSPFPSYLLIKEHDFTRMGCFSSQTQRLLTNFGVMEENSPTVMVSN